MSVLNHDILFEKYFEEISQIPRESGNEGGMVRYYQNFAKEHGLRCYSDEWNNAVLYQAGSPGYENAPTLILHAHSDMVCVKEPGIQHCFGTDPIQLVLEGDKLRANGTSLGADDGAGVATILALLADSDCVHPPIEAFFTAAEETGMDGAANFDYSKLKGRRLITMDSGGENCTSVNAAACESVEIQFPITRTKGFCQLFALQVKGLTGGHSGACIDMERGNALKIAAALLREYEREELNVQITSFQGGSASNVIPSSCTVEFTCDHPDVVEQVTQEYVEVLRRELLRDEPDLQVILQSTSKNAFPITREDTKKILDLVTILPHGRHHKSTMVEGFVTASSNVAMIDTQDKLCRLSLSLRAETERKRKEIRDVITAIAGLMELEEKTLSKTPCWEYNGESVMRKRAAELMPQYLGKPLVEEFEHGGLECGYFADRIPGVDIFVIGPVGREVHSTKEWLDLASAHRVYDFMVHYLPLLKD